MSCQYATALSERVTDCGLGLHGGRPSKGVCTRCVERGENNLEFAASYKPPTPPSFTPPTFPQLAGSPLVPQPPAVAGSGAGTELKKLLKRSGITASPTCSCNRHALEMDARGIEWCEQNVKVIVGWLREEAGKRGLPFVDMAGAALVKLAIRKAKKAKVASYGINLGLLAQAAAKSAAVPLRPVSGWLHLNAPLTSGGQLM